MFKNQLVLEDDKRYKIGIMGGTFDPIHYGHLVIAEQIRRNYNLDKVIFIPVGIPPHKREMKITKGEHRYLMILLATMTNPYLDVSRIEIDKKDVSYTIETMRELNKKYSDKKVEFYFIIGADAISTIETWEESAELLTMCKFIAATRPGVTNSNMLAMIEYYKENYSAEIQTMVVSAVDISSTDIRNRIAGNRPIKYLLPEAVEHYILKNELYSEDNCE
ncbi:MAG: nicotinate-nucleotide adenylyltransferase [Peptostreptococcaceae bacterium]|nr:nicotinate-nucleotide adenylyltransferase [Peptostreptococcaceae bacterium]